MKARPKGFLSEEHIDHNSEVFDYIVELHDYLWRFVRTVYPGALRTVYPGAQGSLKELLDGALKDVEGNFGGEGKRRVMDCPTCGKTYYAEDEDGD